MKELLLAYRADDIRVVPSLEALRELVIATGRHLRAVSQTPIEYVSGPINDGRLAQAADLIHMREGAITFCSPYVGDLRRFPNNNESYFVEFSTKLLGSGIFSRVTFLHGWGSSNDCKAEHQAALRLNLPIREVSLIQLLNR